MDCLYDTLTEIETGTRDSAKWGRWVVAFEATEAVKAAAIAERERSLSPRRAVVDSPSEEEEPDDWKIVDEDDKDAVNAFFTVRIWTSTF